MPIDSHAGRQPDLELLVCVADTGEVAGFLGRGLASWSERNWMWYLLPRPRGSPVSLLHVGPSGLQESPLQDVLRELGTSQGGSQPPSGDHILTADFPSVLW